MSTATRYYDKPIETMPPQQREQWLDRTLRRVLKHAYTNAPAVKETFDQAGVDPSQVRTMSDLVKVPVLTRDRLIEQQRARPPFGGYLAKGIETVWTVYVSPGPLYWPQERGVPWKRQAKCLFTTGLGPGDVVVVTTAYHMVPAGLLFHDALTNMGVAVVPGGPGNTELQVQVIRDLGVTGFVGFPSFLMILVEKATSMGYDWKRDFKLKKAMVVGEVPSAATRKAWQEQYGISTTQTYGFVPVGLIAYECEEKNGMHVADESLMEIVDPSTGKQLGPGECGEVVVTLTDEVFPLIRYGTGDLACYAENPCPCGRTSIRLLRIMGRIGDASKVRGMFIHPKQIDDVLAPVAGVGKWTLLVDKDRYRDEIALRLEVDDQVADRLKVEEVLQKRVPEICHLRLDRIEFVSRGSVPGPEDRAILDLRKGRISEV